MTLADGVVTNQLTSLCALLSNEPEYRPPSRTVDLLYAGSRIAARSRLEVGGKNGLVRPGSVLVVEQELAGIDQGPKNVLQGHSLVFLLVDDSFQLSGLSFRWLPSQAADVEVFNDLFWRRSGF